MSGDDVPRPAADAVSLHTIAERDDYTTQEQADADYALALSLDEEEEIHAQRIAETAAQARDREALIAREQDVEQSRRRILPYRDDPDDNDVAEDYIDNTPYRDDPEAVVENVAGDPPNHETSGQRREYIRGCTSWIRRLAPKSNPLRPLVLKRSLWAVSIALVSLTILFSIIWLASARRQPEQASARKHRAFEESGSTERNLVLDKLYPKLEDGTSNECRNAWENLGRLHCHEAVLWSVWDKGDGDAIRDSKMDIYAYSTVACDTAGLGCGKAIRRLKEDILKGCTKRTDRFDVLEYRKRELQYFKEEDLDDGPVQVIESLRKRYDRLCDRPYSGIWGTPIAWGTYPAELWMRWGIADGKDADTDLRYLETFMNATREKKIIEAHVERGSIETERGTIQYEVEVPERKVGPGEGETTCEYSMLSWLERKWSSFEYGAILDPHTGEPMGLAAFNDVMETAVKRCEEKIPGWIKRARHWMWEQYNWWCDGAPCQEDKPVPGVVLRLLNGLSTNDHPFPDIQSIMSRPGLGKETVEALQALHDGLLSMPCGIWHIDTQFLEDIAPSDYRVRQLCSNECRNSVDRIQRQHGELFAKASQNSEVAGIFSLWDSTRTMMNVTCKGPDYDEFITNLTPFCAPGYAFLGHYEWLLPLPETAPSKKDILAAFAPAVDTLAKSLPGFIYKPSPDVETQRRLARQISESVCNRCASELLAGNETNREKRVAEFLSDDEIDEEEYKRVVRLHGVTCAKIMFGTNVAKEKEHEYMSFGLD
jgi:hypothetical protein